MEPKGHKACRSDAPEDAPAARVAKEPKHERPAVSQQCEESSVQECQEQPDVVDDGSNQIQEGVEEEDMQVVKIEHTLATVHIADRPEAGPVFHPPSPRPATASPYGGLLISRTPTPCLGRTRTTASLSGLQRISSPTEVSLDRPRRAIREKGRLPQMSIPRLEVPVERRRARQSIPFI